MGMVSFRGRDKYSNRNVVPGLKYVDPGTCFTCQNHCDPYATAPCGGFLCALSLSLFPTSTYSLRRCRKVEKVKPCGKCQVMAWIAFQSLAPLCRPRLFILTGWGPVAVAEGDGQGFAFPVCNHYVPESNCISVPFHYATLRGLKSHFTVAPL